MPGLGGQETAAMCTLWFAGGARGGSGYLTGNFPESSGDYYLGSPSCLKQVTLVTWRRRAQDSAGSLSFVENDGE